MSDYFHTLVDQLHEHHMLSDPPYVHGLLTGFATTPDGDLEKLYLEIAGERPLPEQLREELIDVIDFLGEDLSINDFHALFRPDRDNEPERWINGYLKCVELHEEQWREETSCIPRQAPRLSYYTHSSMKNCERNSISLSRATRSCGRRRSW